MNPERGRIPISPEKTGGRARNSGEARRDRRRVHTLSLWQGTLAWRRDFASNNDVAIPPYKHMLELPISPIGVADEILNHTMW
jgi:hypothetical protein